MMVAASQSAEPAAAAPQAEPASAVTHSAALSSADVEGAQTVSSTEPVTAPPATADTPSPRPLTRQEQIQQDRRSRRQARYQEIVALEQQGWSLRRIARELGVGRRTVHRYVTTGRFPEIAQRRSLPSILDRFEPYLRQRWQEGCHNAMQLFREIAAQGFTGSRPSLSRWAAQLRHTRPQPSPSELGQHAPAVRQPKRPPEKRRQLSPAQAAWLLVSQPEALKAEERMALEDMRHASTELATAYQLAQAFAKMVREHTADALPAWLESAKTSCLAELRSFAHGIEQDLAAVTAGLSLKWSQGQVEGQVNRLKLVKRLMYGRANFDLLKKRVLGPT
jgi:transposase